MSDRVHRTVRPTLPEGYQYGDAARATNKPTPRSFVASGTDEPRYRLGNIYGAVELIIPPLVIEYGADGPFVRVPGWPAQRTGDETL